MIGRVVYEAIESYDKALELKPDHNQALYLRGVSLISLTTLARDDEAKDSYNRAILRLEDYKLWHRQGFTLYKLSMYTDDRVFLSLPQEMRPLLREALGLEP
jgi:tetratricopeptide (TPR) repeat protein